MSYIALVKINIWSGNGVTPVPLFPNKGRLMYTFSVSFDVNLYKLLDKHLDGYLRRHDAHVTSL